MTGDPHDHDEDTPADLADEVSAWAAKLTATPTPPEPEPEGADLDAADAPEPPTSGADTDPEPAESDLSAAPDPDAPVPSAEPAAGAEPTASEPEAVEAELFAEPAANGSGPRPAGAVPAEESGDLGAEGDPTPADPTTEADPQAEATAEADSTPTEPAPDLAAALEAVLMVVDEPIPAVQFAQVLETPRVEVEATLHRLAEEYTASGRGFDLREVAGGWRFYSRPECAPVVERFILDGQQARLTQAALETLAVIAYRQPVSRTRVSGIRGVNCDGVVRTLLSRGLVEEAGTEQDSNATLYRTTTLFLERLGLQSVDELPDIAPYLPEVDELDGEDVAG